MNNTTPMLTGVHLINQTAKLSSNGISFSMEINDGMRKAFHDMLQRDSSSDDFSAKTETTGSFCQVNPPQLPPHELVTHFTRMQSIHAKGERIAIAHGLSAEDNKGWRAFAEADLIHEGQQVNLVCFRDQEPVGFVRLDLSLIRHPASRTVSLRISIPLCYAAAHRRGQGVGFDLCLASVTLCGDVFVAMVSALPEGWSADAFSCAELENEAGESFMTKLHTGLSEIVHEQRENSPSKVGDIDAIWEE